MTGKNELPCGVVRDLLPLYHDGVVCDETRAAVSEHLKHCGDCDGEYAALCKELPVEKDEPSTKNQFIKMMNRKKTKQAFITVLSAIAACALLAAAYFGQMQLPVVKVSNDDLSVKQVYRFKTDEGYKLFVMYDTYRYDFSTGKISTENNDTLVMNIVKPLIGGKSEKRDISFWVYEYGYETGDDGERVFQDFSTVKFGNEIIWTAEENADDKIPPYVYAYEKFENGENVLAWTWDKDEGWMAASYKDGTVTKWDLEGNVLFDSHGE